MSTAVVAWCYRIAAGETGLGEFDQFSLCPVDGSCWCNVVSFFGGS